MQVWALADCACLKTLEGHDGSVLKLAFVCNGMQVPARPGPARPGLVRGRPSKSRAGGFGPGSWTGSVLTSFRIGPARIRANTKFRPGRTGAGPPGPPPTAFDRLSDPGPVGGCVGGVALYRAAAGLALSSAANGILAWRRRRREFPRRLVLSLRGPAGPPVRVSARDAPPPLA